MLTFSDQNELTFTGVQSGGAVITFARRVFAEIRLRTYRSAAEAINSQFSSPKTNEEMAHRLKTISLNNATNKSVKESAFPNYPIKN